jgi:ribosomal protein S18 acetylase RimI-like enzyme
VIQRLLDEWSGSATSMALFVLKNNPAVRFYERSGFSVARETKTKFVMRLQINGRSYGRASTLHPVHARNP